MLLGVSERLSENIMTGLRGSKSGIFQPQCILNNPTTGFNLELPYINYFVIEQKFDQTYMDMFGLGIDVRPRELRKLIESQQDLECTLILTPLNEFDYIELYNQEKIVFNLKVLVDDQTDLSKKYPEGLFQNNDSTGEIRDEDVNEYTTSEQFSAKVSIDLHLVEPEAYRLRHIQFNSMFTEATMEAIIHWVGMQISAAEVNVAPPDNTQSYKNCVIPPMHSFATIFPFLQERYGVYSKGIGYYFTDKKMYVYPLYETSSDKSVADGIMHLLNAPEKYFLGMSRYHSEVDQDIYVVSVSPKELKVTATEGVENVGNVQMSTNADGTLDSFVQADGQGGIVRNSNDITSVSMQNTAINMTNNTQNVKYNGETTNLYNSTSKMAAVDGVLIAAGWLRAYPRLIKPGQPVIYHYDAPKADYRTQNGRVLAVKYVGRNNPSMGPEHCIIFDASIIAKLEADLRSSSDTQSLANFKLW